MRRDRRRRGAPRALERAQQLGLELERQLADLVEEQGAAVGLLERAGARAIGAGEGALFVAEQLRLDQRRRQRAAVDDDEGALGARRGAVQRLGEHLLAGAGLAFDEHRRVARRRLLARGEERAHRGRVADEAAERARRQDVLDLVVEELPLELALAQRDAARALVEHAPRRRARRR